MTNFLKPALPWKTGTCVHCGHPNFPWVRYSVVLVLHSLLRIPRPGYLEGRTEFWSYLSTN